MDHVPSTHYVSVPLTGPGTEEMTDTVLALRCVVGVSQRLGFEKMLPESGSKKEETRGSHS